jgi:hypothetical protein
MFYTLSIALPLDPCHCSRQLHECSLTRSKWELYGSQLQIPRPTYQDYHYGCTHAPAVRHLWAWRALVLVLRYCPCQAAARWFNETLLSANKRRDEYPGHSRLTTLTDSWIAPQHLQRLYWLVPWCFAPKLTEIFKADRGHTAKSSTMSNMQQRHNINPISAW